MSGQVGISRVKSGKVGQNIFCPILVVVTLLHQFLRIRSLFPVLASSLRCSSTTPTDDRLMPFSWRLGPVVGFGRSGSGQVGSGREKSGRSGQFSLLWSFAHDFEHESSLFSLGTGQFAVLYGPCFAFRFAASGRHGFMTVRSQQCLFAFCHRAIISLFLVRLPCISRAAQNGDE